MIITTSDGNYRFLRNSIDFVHKDIKNGVVIAGVNGKDIVLASCSAGVEKQKEYLSSIYNSITDMLADTEQHNPYRPERSYYCEVKYKSLGRFPLYEEWLEMDKQRREDEASHRNTRRRA